MAEKTDTKLANLISTPLKAKGIATGKIIYNRYIDSWQAIDSTGKIVLSCGKEAAIEAYPNFVVKG